MTLKTTAARNQAKRTAEFFLRGDDYIAKHNRSFDNLWEQGNGDDVAAEFAKLYASDTELQRWCRNSRFFCPAMVKEA